MLHQESGSKLIGFTKEMKCSHCGNNTPFQIRQAYLKQSFMLLPIGTAHYGIFKYCPICEQKEYVTRFKPMYSSNKKIQEVVELLEGGKEITKQWIKQLSAKDKEDVFKRLNSIKAYSVVKFCGM